MAHGRATIQGLRTDILAEKEERLSPLGLTWAQECSMRHCTKSLHCNTQE